MLNPSTTGFPAIKRKVEQAGLHLKDRITLLNMLWEERPSHQVPVSSREIFDHLNELIMSTVHGARIERFRPNGRDDFFHTFEIHTSEKEVLGYLNMLYLRKPLPCYYLVYVEVTSLFRNKGLGNKILKDFREFIKKKGAIGILDNIIPPWEKTYDIYAKLGWKSIDEVVGRSVVDGEGKYMVYIPSSLKVPNLDKKILKVLFRLRKKRPVIEMHDNEAMVKRTIQEFKDFQAALEKVFEDEILQGSSTPLMRFMFTKFITKLLGFRRRIVDLLGYTGGESLGQIRLPSHILSLTIQPYSLENNPPEGPKFSGNRGILNLLPEKIRKEPTLFIESLPLYQRPYVRQWLTSKGASEHVELTISDIMELGFDPTRLRELSTKEGRFIFERISPGFLPSIEKIQALLEMIREKGAGVRIRGASICINPCLLVIQDRGNAYLLRRKLEGIHWDEAFEQLKTAAHLKEMNRTLKIDRMIELTVSELVRWLREQFEGPSRDIIDDLTFFVPWDLEKNYPKICIDYGSSSLDQIWVS